MGAHEIRTMLGGISRQRVYQITGKASFPKSIADLRQGKVWSSVDVTAWIDRHRQPLD